MRSIVRRAVSGRWAVRLVLRDPTSREAKRCLRAGRSSARARSACSGLRHRRGEVAGKPRGRCHLHRRELVQPGEGSRPPRSTTNGAIVTAGDRENGGEAIFLGRPDDEQNSKPRCGACRWRFPTCCTPGGTSKGAGDLVKLHSRPVRRLSSQACAQSQQAAGLAVCGRQDGCVLQGFRLGEFTFRNDRCRCCAEAGCAALRRPG